MASNLFFLALHNSFLEEAVNTLFIVHNARTVKIKLTLYGDGMSTVRYLGGMQTVAVNVSHHISFYFNFGVC